MTPETGPGNEAGQTTAEEFIGILTDAGTFLGWNPEPIESLLTGEGRIRGGRVAIIVAESGQLTSEAGNVVDGMVAAIDQAIIKRLPLLACPGPGDSAGNEGEPAFLSTVRIVAALARHRALHLPLIVYLRRGSVQATPPAWSSLAQITFIEPNPPVAADAAATESAAAEDEDGTDGRVSVQQLPDTLERVLAILDGRGPDGPTSHSEGFAGVTPSRDDALSRARQRNRPGMMALLRHGASNAILLRGRAAAPGRSTLVLALARFGEMSCIVLGQDRRVRGGGQALDSASLDGLRRAMRLAEDLGLPLVTVIDSPAHVATSLHAGEAQVGQTALALAELVMMPGVRVAVIMGEGMGEAALALLPADRILAAENGWLSPSSEATGLGSPALLAQGEIDWIVPEFPDAAWEPQAFCARIGWSVEHFLAELGVQDPATRLGERLARIGTSGSR
jgi:acetyl-CoA carboxylase alpha subunit